MKRKQSSVTSIDECLKKTKPPIDSIPIVENIEGEMFLASFSGNMEVVLKMEKLGANNYDECVNSACESGQIDVVKHMLKRCTKKGIENAMYTASSENYFDIVLYMLENGGDGNDHIAKRASMFGALDVVKHLFNRNIGFLTECLNASYRCGANNVNTFLSELFSSDEEEDTDDKEVSSVKEEDPDDKEVSSVKEEDTDDKEKQSFNTK